jgi:hypothetical protein
VSRLAIGAGGIGGTALELRVSRLRVRSQVEHGLAAGGAAESQLAARTGRVAAPTQRPPRR